MMTVLEVVKKTSDFFAAKGIESPRLNAELLIGHALGLPDSPDERNVMCPLLMPGKFPSTVERRMMRCLYGGECR